MKENNHSEKKNRFTTRLHLHTEFLPLFPAQQSQLFRAGQDDCPTGYPCNFIYNQSFYFIIKQFYFQFITSEYLGLHLKSLKIVNDAVHIPMDTHLYSST